MPVRRAFAVGAAGLLAAAALSGCSAIDTFLHDTFPDQFGPQRGADGAVSAPVDAHSYYLEVGDCFDFPDPDVRTEVQLVPCAQEHTFEVIGKGELSLQEQKTQDLQLTVSAKCAEPFAAFQAAAPAGSRPDQEFLIAERRIDDRTVTVYLCAAALTKL